MRMVDPPWHGMACASLNTPCHAMPCHARLQPRSGVGRLLAVAGPERDHFSPGFFVGVRLVFF